MMQTRRREVDGSLGAIWGKEGVEDETVEVVPKDPESDLMCSDEAVFRKDGIREEVGAPRRD